MLVWWGLSLVPMLGLLIFHNWLLWKTFSRKIRCVKQGDREHMYKTCRDQERGQKRVQADLFPKARRQQELDQGWQRRCSLFWQQRCSLLKPRLKRTTSMSWMLTSKAAASCLSLKNIITDQSLCKYWFKATRMIWLLTKETNLLCQRVEPLQRGTLTPLSSVPFFSVLYSSSFFDRG